MPNQDWDSYDRAADRGPVALWLKVLGGVAICAIPTIFIAHACSAADEAAGVAQQEFGAKASLQKYEWFKNAAAQLDAKQATLKVYENRFQDLKDQYGEKTRGEWARDDREQWSIWRSEAAGIAASYNTLAGEYNAQMAKFNWRFASAGQLPSGATNPLPREFKPYISE